MKIGLITATIDGLNKIKAQTLKTYRTLAKHFEEYPIPLSGELKFGGFDKSQNKLFVKFGHGISDFRKIPINYLTLGEEELIKKVQSSKFKYSLHPFEGYLCKIDLQFCGQCNSNIPIYTNHTNGHEAVLYLQSLLPEGESIWVEECTFTPKEEADKELVRIQEVLNHLGI